MASSKVGVLAGCKGCSSPPSFSPPPPYSVQVEEEAERRTRISPPLYSKGILVGGLIQDERGSQEEKTKLLVMPSDDQKPLLGRNDPLSNDAARPRRTEGTPSVVRALFGNGDRRVSKLRLVEEELEALKQSSGARISALEGQLRAADAAALAASHAATTAATAASHAADTAAAAASYAAATAAAAAATAAADADTAAKSAAAATAQKIELLEYKLLAEAKVFELKLEAAESSAKQATRIARLEERISVAGLRPALSDLRNPVVPGPRRNFSS